jgi:predicted small lipoprotein YifL
MRALLLIAIVLLAGCGQSGDLYLPPKQPTEAAPPIATPPPVEGTQDQKEEQKKESP